MFVFVDEMRLDKRDSMQTFAYNLRRNPFSRKLLVQGERVSTTTEHTMGWPSRLQPVHWECNSWLI